MKSLVIVMLCGTLAACSQTAGSGGQETASAAKPAVQSRQAAAKQAGKTADSCDEAIQAQANSAMLGGALGMVGSFGGYGGRGGAVAAQVASTAGGMVARSQSQKAQEAVMRECHRRGY